jgi:hypothetical protein
MEYYSPCFGKLCPLVASRTKTSYLSKAPMKKLIMKQLFSFCFILLVSCSNQSNHNDQAQTGKPKIKADTSYVWTKLLDSAGWKKSYNFQMFTIKDTLWTFHPDGNWYSTNGKDWTKSPLPNSISNLAFLDYIQFNNAVYGLGHFEGNIDRFTLKPEIYKTTDFKNWEILSTQSSLPRRFFYHPFVFDNKIWIIGGEDEHKQYADIWNSEDGVNWTIQKDNLPFGKRSGSQIVLLNKKLFLIGQDVWSSADALNWQKETNEILKDEKEFYPGTAIVFENKIWLLGCNRNGKFRSQVFVSSDGKTWEGQEAPWTPRGGIAATVYKNKIFMTGGKYGGLAQDNTTTEFVYSNDVWSFEKVEH